jgi:hypothetical protein
LHVPRLDPLVTSHVELNLLGGTHEKEGTLECTKGEPNRGDDTLEITQSGKGCQSQTSEIDKTDVVRQVNGVSLHHMLPSVSLQQPSKYSNSSVPLKYRILIAKHRSKSHMNIREHLICF